MFQGEPIGNRLGRYEVVRRIGGGGMADVFLGRATGPGGFEKLVALKRIRQQFGRSPSFARMFLAEARLAARLEHENLVQVFDLGEAGDGSLFIAMEYVDGADLRALLGPGGRASSERIPTGSAVAIAIGVAAGLHGAHERGLVHRDVTPSNVLVGRDGRIKLADFGIARAADGEGGTETGTTRGKAGYMAPEQCRGEPVDRRADVFALGIVLYEMTTGRLPFAERNPVALAAMTATTDAPAPSVWTLDYPEALERIVLRAIARDPAERFATADAFQRELEELAVAERLDVSRRALAAVVEGQAARAAALEVGTETMSLSSARGVVSGDPPRRSRRARRVLLAAALPIALGAAAWVYLAVDAPAQGRQPQPQAAAAPEMTPRSAQEAAPAPEPAVVPRPGAAAAKAKSPARPARHQGRPARARRPSPPPHAPPAPARDDDPDSPFPGEWRPH